MVKRTRVLTSNLPIQNTRSKSQEPDNEITPNFYKRLNDFINSSDFGNILAESLNIQDRSASWLARQIGVHPSTVSKWLSGESRPSDVQTMNKLVDFLRSPVGEQFYKTVNFSEQESIFQKLTGLKETDLLNGTFITIDLPEVFVQIDTRKGKLTGTLQGKLKIDTTSLK